MPPIEDADDRAAFLDPEEFGSAITWTRGASSSTLNAIFSRPSILVDGGGEAETIDRAAVLYCREADLPAGYAEDDAIAVDGQAQAFAVKAVRLTGDGMAYVDLKRAS